MTQQVEFSWKTKSNKKIYAYHWGVQDPKAVICLVHGLGEHCRRYDHLASFFNEHGYSIFSFDNIGHGKSEGKRGHTPSYKNLTDNVGELLQQAEKHYPLLPKILYGHSLGGNLSLTYVLKNNPNIIALIATGAFVTLPKPAPAALVAFGRVMRKIIPSLLQSNQLDVKYISKDESEVKKYLEDPLVHDRLSVNMGIEMLDAAKWLESYKGHIGIPVLMMHGEEDGITSPNGSALLAKNLEGDVTHHEWKGMYHEIHNEPDQYKVFEYTLNWMESKIEKWKSEETE